MKNNRLFICLYYRDRQQNSSSYISEDCLKKYLQFSDIDRYPHWQQAGSNERQGCQQMEAYIQQEGKSYSPTTGVHSGKNEPMTLKHNQFIF